MTSGTAGAPRVHLNAAGLPVFEVPIPHRRPVEPAASPAAPALSHAPSGVAHAASPQSSPSNTCPLCDQPRGTGQIEVLTRVTDGSGTSSRLSAEVATGF